jgi:hypothetical protein
MIVLSANRCTDVPQARLIATKAENAVVRKTATDDGPVNLNARRPTRARLRPEA